MTRLQIMLLLGIGMVLAAEPLGAREDSTGLREAPDAQGIMTDAFHNLYGFSSIQQVEIRASIPGGREFLRSAQVIRQGVDDELNRMLVRFLGPPDLRGVGVLLMERDTYQYDAFLYQPVFKKVRRVSVYQRVDPFFGTDLAFEDLEAKRASQWLAVLLREDRVGDRAVAVIELVPKDFPSGYDRIIGWFDRELPIMLRAEFFRGGKPLKVLEVDPGKVIQQAGFHIPTELVFKGASGSKTVVAVSEVEVRSSISKSVFTQSALEFGDEKRDAARH